MFFRLALDECIHTLYFSECARVDLAIMLGCSPVPYESKSLDIRFGRGKGFCSL